MSVPHEVIVAMITAIAGIIAVIWAIIQFRAQQSHPETGISRRFCVNTSYAFIPSAAPINGDAPHYRDCLCSCCDLHHSAEDKEGGIGESYSMTITRSISKVRIQDGGLRALTTALGAEQPRR
jgi:hypothetical protein